MSTGSTISGEDNEPVGEYHQCVVTDNVLNGSCSPADHHQSPTGTTAVNQKRKSFLLGLTNPLLGSGGSSKAGSKTSSKSGSKNSINSTTSSGQPPPVVIATHSSLLPPTPPSSTEPVKASVISTSPCGETTSSGGKRGEGFGEGLAGGHSLSLTRNPLIASHSLNLINQLHASHPLSPHYHPNLTPPSRSPEPTATPSIAVSAEHTATMRVLGPHREKLLSQLRNSENNIITPQSPSAGSLPAAAAHHGGSQTLPLPTSQLPRHDIMISIELQYT